MNFQLSTMKQMALFISVSFLSASRPKSIATLYLYLKTYITNHNCLLCWESNLAGHSWIPPPSWQDHVTCVTISASRQPSPAHISKSTPHLHQILLTLPLPLLPVWWTSTRLTGPPPSDSRSTVSRPPRPPAAASHTAYAQSSSKTITRKNPSRQLKVPSISKFH